MRFTEFMALRPVAVLVAVGSFGILLPDSIRGDERAVGREVFARLSVTVRGKDEKGPALPTPFTVLPDEKRAAIYVPESGGILLLDGDQVRHHFPIPAVPADASSAVDDLDATDQLLVGGRWTPADLVTVELFVFDVDTGKLLEHVESRNPHLGGEANERARFLWRVVADADTVGVYDPRLGASVPLWVLGTGEVPSADQMARMRAGIGFGRDPAWIPTADGSLSVRREGRTTPIAGRDSLLFMDGSLEVAGENGSYDPLALMVHARREQSPSVLIHGARVIEKDGLRMGGGGGLQASTGDDRLGLSADWIRGRAICVRRPNLYWPYLGRDYLEIRRMDANHFFRPSPDRLGP